MTQRWIYGAYTLTSRFYSMLYYRIFHSSQNLIIILSRRTRKPKYGRTRTEQDKKNRELQTKRILLRLDLDAVRSSLLCPRPNPKTHWMVGIFDGTSCACVCVFLFVRARMRVSASVSY